MDTFPANSSTHNHIHSSLLRRCSKNAYSQSFGILAPPRIEDYSAFWLKSDLDFVFAAYNFDGSCKKHLCND